MGESRETIEGRDGTVVAATVPSASLEDAPLPKAHRTGKSPAFQFYPKDFLSSTKVQRMSLTERGAYVTLLSYQWLDGSLPTNLTELAALLHVKPLQFDRMWSGPLGQCFIERGGRYLNERLEQSRKDQADYRRRQGDRADKRWEQERSRNASALQAPHSRSDALLSSSASASATAKKEERESDDVDSQASRLMAAYPQEGAASIHAVTAALRDVLHGQPPGAFDALMERLESHKRSAKWADKGGKFIPRLDNYLKTGTHRQVMPSVDDVARESANAKLPAWARS